MDIKIQPEHPQLSDVEECLDVTHRYGVGGAAVDVQGGGVVVGDGRSGQRGRRGEAHRVAAV